MESSSSLLFSSPFAFLSTTLFTIGVLKFVVALYHVYTHWSKRSVPYIQAIPNLGLPWQLLFRRLSTADYMKYIYNYDSDAKYIGMMDMATPLVVLRDPELIKDVMVKDFEYFTDHAPFLSEELDPLFGKTILSLRGDRWKEMRTTLSPSFTASKMKVMFELVSRCSHEFTEYLADHPELWPSIDTDDALRRHATDVIATSAFGISVNSMKERNNEFFMRGMEVIDFSSFVAVSKMMLFRATPRIMKALGLTFFSSATSKFFKRIVAETIKIREDQGIVRPDMIHLLMQAREKEGRSVHDMTLDDIVSQVFIFFFAGFDTASTLMCFLVHELAVHRDIQDRLYEEIEHFAERNGEISYESMSKMTYLDMVVSEALRKYPPAPLNDRICVKSYKLPPSKPGCKSVIIEPNSLIWLPVYALHHDPNYYPNPSKFDPERFSDKNKDNIVPYTYMPFGLGPRMCIGNRFALMEVKILVIHLLHKFIFKASEKTVEPMVFDKSLFALKPDGGFWISLEKREK
ncbi:PREDICTED: cytochrome P450 9e2-like [Dinoponera quadriceps]|uniref:Cytochrome P450 9e2-like n=1 Tax=Dinoponera quadriceps TaxID=609295 RepID=A0A6P3YEQ8_DINQU|nr:PREDICTED: cytochrome P450 9e2-like [Dinoponera quadriceps]